jgi:hypothetical protein
MRPHPRGIDSPALVVCGLELNGYTIELNGYAIEPIDDDVRLVGVRPLHPELVADRRRDATAPDRRGRRRQRRMTCQVIHDRRERTELGASRDTSCRIAPVASSTRSHISASAGTSSGRPDSVRLRSPVRYGPRIAPG